MASRRKFGFCTLCLGKKRNLQDAFEHSEIGFKPQMVIEDLLHVQVCNRGHFPWMICGRCMQKLNAFRNFKCDAMKSLKVLKILLLDDDSEDDLQIPTNSEFNDVGEQNLSTGNGRYVLKQEEDEVTEFHRSDSEIAVKVEEVTITESEETSFPSNIEDCSEDTPEYLQNYASVSEFGDGCSEGDTCIGVSCDDDEDDELRLYLESDRESEVGGQGEEDESSPCQVSSPQSVPVKTEEDDEIDEHPLASSRDKNSEGESERRMESEVPVKTEEDDEIDIDEHPLASSRDENSESKSEGSMESEVPVKTEEDDEIDIDEHPLASSREENSEGKSEGRMESEGSNVSGANSNLEVAEIREEEESHKTVEDKSLEVPRRTRRSARLQAAKGCDGGNSKEKQGNKNGEEKNDLMMQAGADGKNTRWKKTKGMETKSVSPMSSVSEQMMERNRELTRERKRKYLQSMSEEKRRELHRKKRESAKRRLANMTEEQKKEFTRRRTESWRRWRSQISDEERKVRNRRNEVYRKKRIDRMSDEEREEYRRRMKERKRKYRSQ